MCGRYVLYAAPHKLKDLFGTDNLPNFPPRYNAAPMQDMPVIIRHRMGMARWGFMPPWVDAADKAMGAKMINARSETVAQKPSFRDAWMKGRRCLVPMNGIYEWKKDEDGKTKQPYYIHHAAGNVIACAGLWAKNGDDVTFTILTKDADGPISKLHHRMPVMFSPQQAAQWFDASHQDAFAMIAGASGKDMAYHAVDKAVGKVANDSEELIAALTSHPSAA